MARRGSNASHLPRRSRRVPGNTLQFPTDSSAVLADVQDPDASRSDSVGRSAGRRSSFQELQLDRPGGHELPARLQQVLGEHLDVREHRHEIRVPGPARDDVQVDVVDDAGAGDPAEVPARVVALWREDRRPARPCPSPPGRAARAPRRRRARRRRPRAAAGPPSGAPTRKGTCSAGRARARRGGRRAAPRRRPRPRGRTHSPPARRRRPRTRAATVPRAASRAERSRARRAQRCAVR